jgi:CxxC motif-containing protein (DUF1111 family)
MRPKAGFRLRWLAAFPVLGLLACQQAGVPIFPTELDQASAAGDWTIHEATSAAYSLPPAILRQADLMRHLEGDRGFEAQFVSAPAPVNPGLGPVFNNNSCVACHKGDGGGRPPEDGKSSPTMLFRLSVDGTAADGGPVAVPGYGLQLQDQAVHGVAAEAKVRTRYERVEGTFADGTPYTLRRPVHEVHDAYQPLPADVRLSARLSSPVFGLGLLEAVPESAILQRADEGDRDGDGISGRPNYVWDVEAGATRLGRFGWKANTPTLMQQVAAAYQQDMGLTSERFPKEASDGQPQGPAAGAVELPAGVLADVVHYVRTLGVPARRAVADPQVVQGARLFSQASCAGCHTPTMVTGAVPDVPELGFQVLHPYTDLLLHDMGPALADGRADYLASGSEWRTPPLWGLGLRRRVQGHESMLHDGRANGPQEAILWHGGEAEGAKEAYKRMTAEERAALLAFLGSL